MRIHAVQVLRNRCGGPVQQHGSGTASRRRGRILSACACACQKFVKSRGFFLHSYTLVVHFPTGMPVYGHFRQGRIAQTKTPPLGGGVCRDGRCRPVQCQILARASSSASVISPCGYRPSSRRRRSVVLTLMPPGCFNHCASVFSESCLTFRRNSAISPAAFISTRNPQAVSGQFT